jgi:hypothetical protein
MTSFYEKYHTLNDAPLFQKIVSLPIRPYPSLRIEPGTDRFTIAICHESFPEVPAINATYLGKTIDTVDLDHVAVCGDTPFLDYSVLVYFWPMILMTIYLYPDSRLAYGMYFLVFKPWLPEEGEKTETTLTMLTPLEIQTTYKVLAYARDHLSVPVDATRGRRLTIERAIEILDSLTGSKDT